MRDSLYTPLFVALLVVISVFGFSSVSFTVSNQLAQVGSALASTSTPPLSTNDNVVPGVVVANLPVRFAVSVSSSYRCATGVTYGTVGMLTDPITSGYFSLTKSGGSDLGDREPGVWELPAGSYAWRGVARTGFTPNGEMTGVFTVHDQDTCRAAASESQTTNHAATSSASTGTVPTVLPDQPATGLTLLPVSFALKIGGSCTEEKDATQVVVEVEPRSGGTVMLARADNTALQTVVPQGVQYLQNGSYLWTGVPAPGYRAGAVSSGTFVLNACPAHIHFSVAPGEVCDRVEEGVPVSFSTNSSVIPGRFSVKDTVTGEVTPVESGTAYFSNGSYAWEGIIPVGFNAKAEGITSGTFTVSACAKTSAVPESVSAATLLFFKDNVLVSPQFTDEDRVVVRTDASNLNTVRLVLIGKDGQRELGPMIKEPKTSRFTFLWHLGGVLPGTYTIVARGSDYEGREYAHAARLITVTGTVDVPQVSAVPDAMTLVQKTLSDLPPEIILPEMPLFTDFSTRATGTVRGIGDFVSETVIHDARAMLPEEIRTPQDFRAFCSDAKNDASCLQLIPKEMRKDMETQILAARREMTDRFAERIKDVALGDQDGDGITDFDEIHFYRTSPTSTDTDQDGVSDGNELLAGKDPLAKRIGKTDVPIVFENPKIGGKEDASLLAIQEVVVASTTTDKNGKGDVAEWKMAGKAPPGAFVTIYVFSEPLIVTVKADKDGVWSVTLKKTLPDGSHQVFAAMTDSAGKILAKSAPVPFVKTAQAVTVGAIDIPGTADKAPGLFSGASLYAFIFILIGVIGLAVISIGLIVRARRDDVVGY